MMKLIDDEEPLPEQFKDIPNVERETFDPKVIDYLSQNYPEKLSDLAGRRKSAISKFDKNNDISGGDRFLAGLSAALTGGNAQDLLNPVQADIDRRRSRLLDKFRDEQSDLSGIVNLEDKITDRAQNKFKFDRAKKAAVGEDDLAARETDPNSYESKTAQQLAKSMGYKGDIQGLTAAKFKSLSPVMEKMYGIEQNRLNRQDARAARQGDAQIKTNLDQQNKDERTFADAAQTALGVKRGASSGNYGMANKRSILAENALRLIKQAESGDIKASRQFEADLASTLAAVTTGGNSPAQQTIEHFMSKTGKKDLAGLAEYITGNPQNAVSREFMENMKHSMETEKDFWNQKKNNITGGMELALESVFKRSDERGDDLRGRWKRIQDAKDREGAGDAAPATAGPKPGTIEDGHMFKGGDPADKNNWKEI